MNRTKELIYRLKLTEHPEGGFYKETYRSDGEIPKSALPENFSENRNYCTGIYFLLTSDTFSAFHRIQQDEMWHFYEGSSLTIHIIDEKGNYSFQKLGLNLNNNETPQFTVPKKVWFAAKVNEPGSYSFVGCTVSPGFNFDDFELAERGKLTTRFPIHKDLIKKFTR